ncbi:hypothetical protein CYMTET_48780 [Cymbomonas tetramitiformis]|uniref:Uncharacterized protein n=1 Tax=Cymbomonas tetramitiformis TaxID=36881 RepID=A0AAE0EUL8_9CHLO|nr:hypothetical protein CYMTET_48780 [Cymbomonas tetramitiformis]
MVCDGCGSLTKEELLQQYFNGLRRKEEVRAKLDNIGLSLARPQEWEDKQKQRGASYHSAILQVRTVATDVEAYHDRQEAALAANITQRVQAELRLRQQPATPRSFSRFQPRAQAAPAVADRAVYLAGKAQAAVCLAALAGDIEEDSLEHSERNVYDELAELENMAPGSCQLFAAEMGEEDLFRTGGVNHARLPQQQEACVPQWADIHTDLGEEIATILESLSYQKRLRRQRSPARPRSSNVAASLVEDPHTGYPVPVRM